MNISAKTQNLLRKLNGRGFLCRGSYKSTQIGLLYNNKVLRKLTLPTFRLFIKFLHMFRIFKHCIHIFTNLSCIKYKKVKNIKN